MPPTRLLASFLRSYLRGVGRHLAYGSPERPDPAPAREEFYYVKSWLPLVTVLLLGAMIGLGGFTFVYARGYSYLSNDPEVCGNCHIMDEHVASWMKASHKTVAVCNDCHTPHNLVGKYTVKARNGFWHSFYFTTGNYPDPLRITEGNHGVTEEACRYCHERITEAIDHGPRYPGDPDADGDANAFTCVRCHRYVGHWVR